jgi:Sulfatase
MNTGHEYKSFPIKQLVGTHDIVWVVIDSLRFDVAQHAHLAAETPHLSALFPDGWECRHAPGNFTLPSHTAMFSGFFPTPLTKPKAGRLFAPRVPGIEALTPDTFVFDERSIPEALAARGYRTVCIGGVGFFANILPITTILPSYFQETYWKPHYGPGRKDALRLQTERAREIFSSTDTPLMLFLNVAATHHPTAVFVEGATAESVETQRASLRHVDEGLGELFAFLLLRREIRPTVLIVCSDHGDAFGEDGFYGHRLSHRTVMEIPYAHVVLDRDFGNAGPL